MLLHSSNQIDIEVVISIAYGWNIIAWAKNIHLGYYPYQQQNFNILSILQRNKIPHRKIFGSRYLIINMKLIIFLKFWKKNVILKKILTCVIIWKILSLSTFNTLSSFSFCHIIYFSHFSFPITNFVSATYRFNWWEP